MRIARDLLLAAALFATAPALPVRAQQPAKRILAMPALQWDSTLSSFHTARHQTIADFSALTGGVGFGMSPSEVDNALADPLHGVSWDSLPKSADFTDDIRSFQLPLARAAGLRTGIAGCTGTDSTVVLLFRRQGLFRISYRFFPDASCRDVSGAASDIFARFVGIDRSVALAVHYRTGSADVVDVNDPGVSYLVPIRWHARAQ
ncbi:MAG TPA: hypothetical protein VN702_07490 [Acetobacteraceae bacterium]|nr:hypothetical protein [Acetobacteraceae bacterium]